MWWAKNTHVEMFITEIIICVYIYCLVLGWWTACNFLSYPPQWGTNIIVMTHALHRILTDQQLDHAFNNMFWLTIQKHHSSVLLATLFSRIHWPPDDSPHKWTVTIDIFMSWYHRLLWYESSICKCRGTVKPWMELQNPPTIVSQQNIWFSSLIPTLWNSNYPFCQTI